jgi:hypothetical protein
MALTRSASATSSASSSKSHTYTLIDPIPPNKRDTMIARTHDERTARYDRLKIDECNITNNTSKSRSKTTTQVNCQYILSNGPQYYIKTDPNTNEPRVTPGRSGLKNWTPLVSTS